MKKPYKDLFLLLKRLEGFHPTLGPVELGSESPDVERLSAGRRQWELRRR
ncbi:MAG: hypothetical protein LC792_01285 [Actinobacteria bacterium]|nr:hypothetical protein [Actinomycetota bacterium]